MNADGKDWILKEDKTDGIWARVLNDLIYKTGIAHLEVESMFPDLKVRWAGYEWMTSLFSFFSFFPSFLSFQPVR